MSHVNIYIYIYIYVRVHLSNLSSAYLESWTPAQASAYTCAHMSARISGAARTQRDAPHRRPAERVEDACGGAPQGRKAAHTYSNVVTDAVFHAPMFALNADGDWSDWNACEPKPPGPRRWEGLARFGTDAWAPGCGNFFLK